MSVWRQISPQVEGIRPSELDVLERRADKIQEELAQGARKPYEEVIDVSSADAHRGGVKPLTFVRQVLAACLYPPLTHSDKLPCDVRQRATMLLAACDGGSVGSYTTTGGIPCIKRRLCEFLSQRDGGAPSFPENVVFTNGSTAAITQMLKVLVDTHGSPPTGVLTPVPNYPGSVTGLQAQGAAVLPYYLSEEHGWELEIGELRRALQSAKEFSKPAALYVINPGNPTGHVQSRKSIEEVIQFAAAEKLFLMADEVYQANVFGEGSEFLSYKRVLAEMGPPLAGSVELASFHSVSKGLMGECGLRGGYLELVNVDPVVTSKIVTLLSMEASSAVMGQLALDLMANPPHPGEPSYPLYAEETQAIRAVLVHNARRVPEVLNSLPGLSCQPVRGGAFIFPRLHLPPRVVEKAKEVGMQPDVFYCSRLLEEGGLYVGPGCEYGQEEGTHHFRFCLTTSVDRMEEVLQRLTTFHQRFMKDFL
ncbi:alanine aminotransferase 2 [Aplochiton taeniatus]